jgi:hypothetical protein
MPAFVDVSQIQQVSVSRADGTTVEGVVLPIVIPLDEVPAELAAFNADSSTHPLAAQAKPIARPVLEALAGLVKT